MGAITSGRNLFVPFFGIATPLEGGNAKAPRFSCRCIFVSLDSDVLANSSISRLVAISREERPFSRTTRHARARVFVSRTCWTRVFINYLRVLLVNPTHPVNNLSSAEVPLGPIRSIETFAATPHGAVRFPGLRGASTIHARAQSIL